MMTRYFLTNFRGVMLLLTDTEKFNYNVRVTQFDPLQFFFFGNTPKINIKYYIKYKKSNERVTNTKERKKERTRFGNFKGI